MRNAVVSRLLVQVVFLVMLTSFLTACSREKPRLPVFP